ncbi:PucR family transcriptional regulator [Pseudonocardia sp. H11422]|uniref:PucR family transcriptional regulator n=1 Tax=Pseudonocardia sp. H11422 TaxID=2835866 RepID=UPI001BDDA007|nr:helix-turn-helix domain-containing protein [Pseudonocardia sp. H11422]
MERWLGSLIAHDARCGTELTATLSEFLEHHGNLDRTASALGIHRSTLRYRLFRIRELTGFDVHDAATRFSLLRGIREWRAR